MGRFNRLARVMADDEIEAAPAADEPDYAFEGYSVEFLEKVALMPIQVDVPAAKR